MTSDQTHVSVSTPTRFKVQGPSREAGFTVIELLVTAVIFITLLAAVAGLLISSTRAYSANANRSETLQDSEAVLHLLRYEISRAGYRGINEGTYGRPFSSGATKTLVVHRTPSGDEITLRYFEDQYLSGADDGERLVTFYVDSGSNALVREELRPSVAGSELATELLVGNIASMEVADVVGRFREQVTVSDLLDNKDPPEFIAGLNMRIKFVDGSDWEFLVGVSNPQDFDVTSGL